MAKVNIYLIFNGNCEEAFNFYRSVFGGEFSYLGKFKDMPPIEGRSAPESDGEKIMHVTYPINEENILQGCDTFTGQETIIGNNFSISINADNEEEADKLFNGLSAGGKVIMPMAKTFWSSYFGTLIDKFGIQWMVSV